MALVFLFNLFKASYNPLLVAQLFHLLNNCGTLLSLKIILYMSSTL